MPPAVTTNEQALLERLKILLRDSTQAGIARRTARPRNSLTRYLRGGKIPLEFGASLVAELGVNPAWLLAGELPVYLADVPAVSADLGNELLQMIRAIDNVSKLKLGALTGRGHAKALREVADTLDRYGSLSARLNRMSAPVLRDLLNQAGTAIEHGDYDRARAIEKVAGRVSEFCDDSGLSRDLQSLRALIHHVDQATDRTLAICSHNFRSALSMDAKLDAIAKPATRYAQVLRGSRSARMAKRVVRMAMSLAEDTDRTSMSYLALFGQEIMANVELGLFGGMGEAVDYFVHHAGRQAQPYVESVKCYHHLHRGTWNARTLAGSRFASFAAASMVLNASCVTDDEEIIERALRRAREVMNPQMPLNQYHVRRGEEVLMALRGKPVPEEPLANRIFGPPGDDADHFGLLVSRAHLLRLSGDNRAIRVMREAQARLAETPPDRIQLPVTVALHLKNVLSGVSPNTRSTKDAALRKSAEQLYRQRIAQGFALHDVMSDN